MIAIFYTAEQAQNCSTNIHNYLTANRIGYNAEKWSELNKSDNEEKWGVKIPNDYPQELVNADELIEKYPENWKNLPIL